MLVCLRRKWAFFSVAKFLLESENNAPSYANPWKSLVVFIQQLKGDYSRLRARHPVPSPAHTGSLKATLFPEAVSASPGTRRAVRMGKGRFCQGAGLQKNNKQQKQSEKGGGRNDGYVFFFQRCFPYPSLVQGSRKGNVPSKPTLAIILRGMCWARAWAGLVLVLGALI